MRVDPTVKMGVGPAKEASPETNPWFWNPNLIGIKEPPEDFQDKLHELHPDIRVVWNGHTERWQVFAPKPTLNHPICHGWVLLFVVQTPGGQYLPLDERTLAKLYQVSGQVWGSGRKYMDAVVRERELERERAERRQNDETWGLAGESFDFTQPKVGYGPISASKVVGQ